MTICYGMIHIMHTCVYGYHVWILVTIAPHSSRVRMDGQDLVEPLVRDGATSSPKTSNSWQQTLLEASNIAVNRSRWTTTLI